MKRIVAALVMGLMLTGCTERTEYGECIGINGEQDPGLVYKVDTTNAILAVIFVETIVAPIVILANNITCPVARKPAMGGK